MSTPTTTVKIMSPEDIAARDVGDIPQFKLADTAAVFRDRELRLRQLAAGHPMRDYLVLMADVAAAQHRALAAGKMSALPSQQALGDCARAGLAPLAPERFARDGHWRDDLQAIVSDLLTRLMAESTAAHSSATSQAQSKLKKTLRGLQTMDAAALDLQADRLLTSMTLGLDLAKAPFIGAALQVYWTRLAQATQVAFPDLAFGRVDDATACPCCGAKPMSSILRVGGVDEGARFLHCGLCQTQWHMVRGQCSHCEDTRQISYQELVADTAPGRHAHAYATVTPPKGAVRVEVCDACGHYLKIVSMEKDAFVEPVADDLASITLDLLVSEAGLERHGVNFMLLFGASPEDGDPDGSIETEVVEAAITPAQGFP